MEISDWWPRLDAETKNWLMVHNGEAVPPQVRDRIIAAGGAADLHEPAIDDGTVGDVQLSDAAVDWVEAAANDEAD